jgi:DNA-binding PucR family transcriptional regulator
VTDVDVGEAMVARYIASVEGATGGDAILDTVEHFLANDRSVDLTARDLGLHNNTIRHRLSRFEEISGRSLRETETVVEVWWALQRRRLA